MRACVFFTENLADVGVVHVGEGLQDLSPLVLGPHHEGVHWPFDVWLIAAAAAALPEYPGVGHAGGAWRGRRKKAAGAAERELNTQVMGLFKTGQNLNVVFVSWQDSLFG